MAPNSAKMVAAGGNGKGEGGGGSDDRRVGGFAILKMAAGVGKT